MDIGATDTAHFGDSSALLRYLSLSAGGDRQAFGDLYNATVSPVYRVVRRLLVDPSQAEEVTQEVFLEIWQSADRFRADRAGVMAWMLMVARRRAIDRIRASQASRERDLRVGIRSVEREYDSVAEHIDARSESARVRVAMGGLTMLQRQAVELSYFEELTYLEIATKLQIPVGTVRTRIRDAKIRLRVALKAAT